MPQTKLIVFSDLDGTLLEHETYEWQAAASALEALKLGGHKLVLASSKTAAEMMPIRAALGFETCPAIVENGAGLLPAGDVGIAGNADYIKILSALESLPQQLQKLFFGFSQMGVERVASDSGLTLEAAKLANDRQFSEPGKWLGNKDQLESFGAALKERGIHVQTGGRYVSLSLGADKVDRMKQITSEFQSNHASSLTVALGDAPNDRDMILAADIGFVIPNPAHSGIPEFSNCLPYSVTRASIPGPQGWNQSILGVLERINNGG